MTRVKKSVVGYTRGYGEVLLYNGRNSRCAASSATGYSTKYTPQSDQVVPSGGPTRRVVNSGPSSVAMSLLMVTAAITDVQLPTLWDDT